MPGFIGSGMISGMYLGASELSAAYIGDVQIYPTTITGLTITSSISAKKSGGTFTVTVRSESAFNIVADNWITLSAASGDSGTTRITVTIGANETGNDRTGGITATTTDNVYTDTCSVYQDNLSIVYVSYVYTNTATSSNNLCHVYDIIFDTGTTTYFTGFTFRSSNGGLLIGAEGGKNDQDDYRFFDTGTYNTLYYDIYNQRLNRIAPSGMGGKTCDWKIGNYYASLDGGQTNFLSGNTLSTLGTAKHAAINLYALKLNRWRITNGNDVTVFDGRAALDPFNNNKPGIYDEISGNWYFNVGDNLTYDP